MDCKPSTSKQRATSTVHSSLPNLSNVYPPGTLLGGHYKIEAVLKTGLRICTFKCVSCSDGRPVVVKIFQIGARARKEMEKSAVNLLDLKHEGIPHYISFFRLDSNFCLVQDYVEGISLAEMISQGNRMSEAEGLAIGRDLLSTLQYLSTRHPPIAHGNISEENILLDSGTRAGKTYLISFACSLDCRRMFSGDMTPGREDAFSYLGSVEGTCTPSHDVFNLGMAFWSMFSGLLIQPLTPESAKIFLESKTRLSRDSVELICRMIDPSPTTRITVEEALEVVVAMAPIPRVIELAPAPLIKQPTIKSTASKKSNRSKEPLQFILPSKKRQLHIRDWKLSVIYLLILSLAVCFWTVDVALEFTGVLLEVGIGLLVLSVCCMLMFVVVFLYYFFAAYTVLHVKFTGTHFSITRSLYFKEKTEEELLLSEHQINDEANTPARRGEFKGVLEDIDLVQILDTTGNGGKRNILLRTKEASFCFGEDLTEAEQIWLVNKIEELRSSLSPTDDAV
eukprot:g7229.t1